MKWEYEPTHGYIVSDANTLTKYGEVEVNVRVWGYNFTGSDGWIKTDGAAYLSSSKPIQATIEVYSRFNGEMVTKSIKTTEEWLSDFEESIEKAVSEVSKQVEKRMKAYQPKLF